MVELNEKLAGSTTCGSTGSTTWPVNSCHLNLLASTLEELDLGLCIPYWVWSIVCVQTTHLEVIGWLVYASPLYLSSFFCPSFRKQYQCFLNAACWLVQKRYCYEIHCSRSYSRVDPAESTQQTDIRAGIRGKEGLWFAEARDVSLFRTLKKAIAVPQITL